jgi:biopolymer transport protein ExbB
MNYVHLFHDITFYAMYAAAAIAVFVVIERQIFYWVAKRDGERMLRAVTEHDHDELGKLDRQAKTKSVAACVVKEVLHTNANASKPGMAEDLSEAIYIDNKKKIIARLWVLDTVVTAAPLLGLVGTILGIIDTFAVLASSGISDPSGVSKGIGTALYATALGISIALIGLLFYNYLRECADRINDQIKMLLLRTGSLKMQPTTIAEVRRMAP